MFKKIIEMIYMVVVFAIPLTLLVLFTLYFNEWFNALDHVQHFMY
jgi:hypothetical protein